MHFHFGSLRIINKMPKQQNELKKRRNYSYIICIYQVVLPTNASVNTSHIIDHGGK